MKSQKKAGGSIAAIATRSNNIQSKRRNERNSMRQSKATSGRQQDLQTGSIANR